MQKIFRQRYIYRWKRGCGDSDGAWDLPLRPDSSVDWEVDGAGRYHFNVPRVVIQYSPERWRVGTEDWPATVDFGLNILVMFVPDEWAWNLHIPFCREFLVNTDQWLRRPGEWRIRGGVIKAWLVVQAYERGIEDFGTPQQVWR